MSLVIVYILTVFLFRSKKGSWHHVAILLLSLLFSTRNKDVPDTEPYMNMFRDSHYYSNVEDGFLKICELFSSIGVSFQFFIFVLSLMMIELWYACTRKLFGPDKVGMMAIMMFSYFGFYFYGIVLRSAMAITLCYFGILLLFVIKRKICSVISFYFVVFLAYHLHQSSAIFVFAPLMMIKINYKLQYAIALSSFVLLFFSQVTPIHDYVEITTSLGENRFGQYLERELYSTGAGFRDFLYSIISIYAIYCSSKIPLGCKGRPIVVYFVNLFVCGSLINSLIWEIPVAARLPMNWLFFEFAVVYGVTQNTIIFNKQTKQTILVLYSILVFCLLLNSVPLILNY